MDPFSAWKVSERDYPAQGSAGEKLAFFAKYAMLAPSTYNTQPWLFIIKDNQLNLYMDRRYALPVIDPEDRQMLMSCAGALYLLEVAANYFGCAVDISTSEEDGEDNDLIAVMRITGNCEVVQDTKKLFAAIVKRQMNRRPFHEGPLAEEDSSALKKAVAQEGAWLHLCDHDEKHILTNMIIEADYIQSANKHFRREIASWMHHRRLTSGDGLPQMAVKHSEIMASNVPLSVRRFMIDESAVATDDVMEQGIPALAVLGSVTGSMENKIKAGRGLMRLLLTAQERGIGVSTLNQPCQLPETRLKLYDELNLQGRAQVILRLGYPKKKTDLAPRRPYNQLIIQGTELSAAKSNAQETKRDIFGFVKNLFKR